MTDFDIDIENMWHYVSRDRGKTWSLEPVIKKYEKNHYSKKTLEKYK